MNNESIQKGLEQDAQQISERIPKEVTQVNAIQKAQSLRRFMDRHKFSQAKVARMLGVSPSVINQYLANTYKGDLETITTKIVDLINTVDHRTRQIRTRPFIETTVARRIGTVIKQTRAFSTKDEGAIALIIGDSGHGKSICLREYAEANKIAIYILLDDAMSATRIFAEIARQIGVDADGSMDNVSRRIIAELQNRETVVMFDEASALTVRQLSQLRTVLVDRCHCPLILAGNADLLKTVMQPKTRRGFESLDQFRSRLMYILNLDEIAAHKGKDGGLYSADDIRRLFEFGGVRLTTDAIAVLKNISKTPQSGRLRTCNRIITALHVAGVGKKFGKIDADLIIKAIEELGLPVKAYLPISIKEDSAEPEQKQAAAKAG